jgi:DNA-binding NtrC family response regulator
MGVSNAGDANGGTLVLDEIGSCPKKVQAGLLRVMNSGEYQTMVNRKVVERRVRELAIEKPSK